MSLDRCPKLGLPIALLVALAAHGCGDDDAPAAGDAGGRFDAAAADGGGREDGSAADDAGGSLDAGAAADAQAPGTDAGGPAVDAGPPRDPSELCMLSCEKLATCAGTAVSPACVTGCTIDAADCSNPQQDALTACLADACDTYIACITAVGCIMTAGP